MVELRKRPAPATTAAPAPAAKRSASKPRSTTSKAKEVVQKAKAAVTGDSNATASDVKPTVPDSETSGATGEIPETVGAGTTGAQTSADQVKKPVAGAETTSAVASATTPLDFGSVDKSLPPTALSISVVTVPPTTNATLSSLISTSTKGIIIFTYPKASTPGCTTQACLFRDNYDSLRAQGYEVYGLSHDSEKANGTFKTKQNLPYTMLCDPDAKLTGALGMKKPGNAKGVLRGVVVLDKVDADGGAVVKVWFQGGPQKTLDSVHEFLA